MSKPRRVHGRPTHCAAAAATDGTIDATSSAPPIAQENISTHRARVQTTPPLLATAFAYTYLTMGLGKAVSLRLAN